MIELEELSSPPVVDGGRSLACCAVSSLNRKSCPVPELELESSTRRKTYPTLALAGHFGRESRARLLT